MARCLANDRLLGGFTPVRRRWLGAALLFCLGLVLAGPVSANGLPPPAGEVLLSIKGQIGNTNADDRADFDLAMLEGIGSWAVDTTAPWTDGRHRYVGVLASDLLTAVGAMGRTVTATGLNDYTVDIPIEDFMRYRVILAFKKDDLYMKIRDKGPLLIVYPRDEFAELKTPRVSLKWVWHLREMIVK